MITTDWKYSFYDSQRHLQVLVDDTKKLVDDIFPKVIRKAKTLHYMIDRYHNPISKRSAQSLYEEILNALGSDNETICSQIFTEENMRIGIFGERAVIQYELFGSRTETHTHYLVKRGAMSVIS